MVVHILRLAGEWNGPCLTPLQRMGILVAAQHRRDGNVTV